MGSVKKENSVLPFVNLYRKLLKSYSLHCIKNYIKIGGIMKKYRTLLIALLLFIGFDQWTKYLAVTHLKGTAGIPIIKDIFHLQYLENHGVAFGMFEGQIWFFLPVTIVIAMIMIFLYSKIPVTKRYIPLRICIVLITAGAFGNMIDRFRYQYVVDFLYFKLINFPIFNIADCYVVIAVILFVFLILFYYKEEELDANIVIFPKKK